MTDLIKIQDPDKPGDYLMVSPSDFDPKKHKEFSAKRAKTRVEDGDGITTVNAEDAKALVEAAATAEELDALQASEQANPKTEGGRKSVLAAIEARRAALNG